MEDYLEYDQLIAFHRNQENPKEQPESCLSFAYETFRYDKMTKQLQSKDNILRTKVFIEINEDMRHLTKVVEITRSTLPAEIRRALKDPNHTIRELASRAFIGPTFVVEGQRFLISKGIVQEISELFDDKIEKIRNNAYQCLLRLSTDREGCEGVLEAGVIEKLVDKLISEKSEKIMTLTMYLLKQLLQAEQGPLRVLQTAFISRTKNLLGSSNVEIRRLSAENLACLSFTYPGKVQIIDHDCVDSLAGLISDPDTEIRAAALLALASLSIEKPAKVELVEGQHLVKIMELLNEDDIQNRLNTIQLIANVAEHPIAKMEFMQCLDKLRDITEEDEELVRRFAEKAISVITWKP